MSEGKTINEQELSAQRKAEQLRETQFEADVREVMSTPAGRRMLSTILVRTAVFPIEETRIERDPKTGEVDVTGTMMAEGAKVVGRALQVELFRYAPDHYAEMLGNALDELRLADQGGNE